MGRPFLGSLNNAADLGRYLANLDLVIFENEFVRTDVLAEAAGERGAGLFCPSLTTLEGVRDKTRQKETLQELKIPTAPFVRYSGGDIRAWLRDATAAWKNEGMIKWGEHGYDGKGVLPYRGNPEDAQVMKFCAGARQRGVSLYVEAKVAFRRELALVACYSVTGEFRAYPLVLSEQAKGVCVWVMGPATALSEPGSLPPVAEAQAKKAEEYAEKIARARKLYGCFAIEFFETPGGELWVNELAPRVHNTGHYTQDAAATSQFENHWRAVLGLPLGSTETAPGFVMRNLLGPPGVNRSRDRMILPTPAAKTFLHWYDKKEIRPGRKIGHLNGRADSANEIAALRATLEKSHDTWVNQVTAAGN
jgi:5-(carboxyamino)imidazole ribonucleotide synthase